MLHWDEQFDTISDRDNTGLFWRDLGTLPVVKIILQIAVPDAELEFLQELLVFHQIKRVEHVEATLNQQMRHHVTPYYLKAYLEANEANVVQLQRLFV